MNAAAPFDDLDTTRAYAQRCANDSGVAFHVVRVHPYSHAARLGMRFGVLRSDEHDDEVVRATIETITPVVPRV